MKESTYQSGLIKRIKARFPDCIVLKNDSSYIQGIPDLLILIGKRWFALEVKRGRTASHQPNQDYYIERMHGMSYASFIYPENEKDVLNDIQQACES